MLELLDCFDVVVVVHCDTDTDIDPHRWSHKAFVGVQVPLIKQNHIINIWQHNGDAAANH